MRGKIYRDLLGKYVLSKKNRSPYPLNLDMLKMEDIRKILVIQLGGIGDIVFTTAAIGAIKKVKPEVEVTILLGEKLQGLLTHHPHFDDIIPFHKEPKRFFRTIKKLTAEKFDLVLIPYISTGPIALPFAFLTGARFILHPPTDRDFSVLVSPGIGNWDAAAMHPASAGLKLVEWTGQSEQGRLYFPVHNEDRTIIKNMLRDYGIGDDDKVIGFQVGSAYRYKMWPIESYIDLGKKILNSADNAQIILTGASAERDLCQSVFKGIADRRVINSAGEISLNLLPALIEKFALMITPDTGPFHIAVAAGTPTISLFSPTAPEIWGPFHDKDIHNVVYKKMPCNPCLKNKCADISCMRQITVDEVYEKACRAVF